MIVLGVDGGGSKTFAVTAQESGRLLAFGRGGCGNYESTGLAAAMAEIAQASRGALAGAGVERALVGCFGLSGADFPEDFEILVEAVRGLEVAEEVHVYNDTRVAFAAGSRRGYGAVVIMGSGMNAAGFAPDGRECRLPGEGYLYGDWGGAGSIGSEVMHLVMRAHDGRGEPTALIPMVLESLGAPNMEDLTRRLYHGEIAAKGIASLTLLAFRAAQQGDAVARSIVERVAEETARAAVAMLRRLGMERDACDVVLGGGIYKAGGAMLFDLVKTRIGGRAPRVEVIVPTLEPVVGGAILALQKAGVEIDEAVRGNLQSGNDEIVRPEAAAPESADSGPPPDAER